MINKMEPKDIKYQIALIFHIYISKMIYSQKNISGDEYFVAKKIKKCKEVQLDFTFGFGIQGSWSMARFNFSVPNGGEVDFYLMEATQNGN